MTDTTQQIREQIQQEKRKNVSLTARVAQKKVRLTRIQNILKEVQALL